MVFNGRGKDMSTRWALLLTYGLFLVRERYSIGKATAGVSRIVRKYVFVVLRHVVCDNPL